MAARQYRYWDSVEGTEEIIDHHENGILVKHDLSDFQDVEHH